MGRTVLLAVVLAAYTVALAPVGVLRGAAVPVGDDGAGFDPLAPRAHAVEALIVAQRFDEALPLAAALRDSYPSEPLAAYWLARTISGLQRWHVAADAWEQFIRVSPAPADACPALPEALERVGLADRARNAVSRCRTADPFAFGDAGQ